MKAYNADQAATLEHPVVSQQEWIEARKKLMQKEKELTHLKDDLTHLRQQLPWVKVEKEYIFEGADKEYTLSDLFDGRSQLIVQHFMLGPGWKEGCPGCSFMADHADGALVHLLNHDVSYVAVSHGPMSDIIPFQKRMGWGFKWVSSYKNDFNYDFHVSATEEDIAKNEMSYNYEKIPVTEQELPGLSVFYKDDNGDIFHTYSTFARGVDIMLTTYNLLEMTPKARNEDNAMNWVKHHDKYETKAPEASSCCSH
ncbi:thioredoxin family protein [Chitinophaga sp. CF418]|uniref:DUF899 domain-containing protein n=1 Tax=Chitinophaga sp. CF418 TaxID=1855287 RepID=UPI000911A621|nr:thioredoxin family protein [Chitinophaga sp. CF418]SHN30334.1 Predicted dithiol-disulfide oxidoreductase, DUF899 family [Chitinophaga sp. CF418]